MPPAHAPAPTSTPGLADALSLGMQAITIIEPVAEKAYSLAMKAWSLVAPFSDDFLPLLTGLIMVFYGGSIPLTIAAVEAFRLTGWDRTKSALVVLFEQFNRAVAASKKDDQVDDNNDGIADVKQIDSKALVQRKISLFLKVTDPMKVTEAVTALGSGCTAVLATLKNEFAQSITLGVSIADIFHKAAEKYLRPQLEAVVPKEHHKWIPFGISFATRMVGVTISWWLTRIIGAVHSATKGSEQLILGLLALATRYHVPIPMNVIAGASSPLFPTAVMALATVGVYCQAWRGFSLPFPLNLIFLPLRIVEAFIQYAMAYSR